VFCFRPVRRARLTASRTRVIVIVVVVGTRRRRRDGHVVVAQDADEALLHLSVLFGAGLFGGHG